MREDFAAKAAPTTESLIYVIVFESKFLRLI
jgi:hypothetical protein